MKRNVLLFISLCVVGCVMTYAQQMPGLLQRWYLQPIITQYFIDNKSEIWLLFLIAHSKR